MRILKVKGLPKKGWIDKDTFMLYACFQILKDFVELEDINYMNQDYVEEVKTLYNWWETRRKGVENDDENMLNRLIKIRPYLWT